MQCWSYELEKITLKQHASPQIYSFNRWGPVLEELPRDPEPVSKARWFILVRKICTSQNTNWQKNLLTNKNTVIIATNLWPLKGSSNSYSLMLYLLPLLRPLLFFQVFFIFHDLFIFILFMWEFALHISMHITHISCSLRGQSRTLYPYVSLCEYWKPTNLGPLHNYQVPLKCWVTSPALSSNFSYIVACLYSYRHIFSICIISNKIWIQHLS